MRAQAVLLLALMIAAPLAMAQNDWPQYGRDATHQSAVPTNQNSEFEPFLERWWNNVSISAKPGSPVAFDNIVYVGDADGNLHAFDRESGGPLWTVEVAGNAVIEGAPAAGEEAVYVLARTGSIYAFDPDDGSPVTGFPLSTASPASGSVLFHSQQNLVIGAGGATIRSYIADTQEQKWTFSASGLFVGNATSGINCPGGTIVGTPVIFENLVFFGSTNKCFFALDNQAFGTISATGNAPNKPRWVFQADDSIQSSPAIDVQNRRVLFGDISGNMYSISVDNNGKVSTATWKYTEPLVGNLPSEFRAGAAIVDDRAIVASRNGKVNALSLTNGAKLWTQASDLGGEIVGTPAVADGKILVGTRTGTAGTMYMLNVTDGGIIDQRPALDKISATPIILGTQGIWASEDGTLHSFGGQKPARADLAVISLSPTSMISGQATTISGTIRNQGELDAPATVVSIIVGSQQISEQSVTALAVDQTDSFSVSYTPSAAGKLTVTAFVDAGRQIQESDESNNVRTVDATVTNPPPPVTQDPASTEKTPAPGVALTLSFLALLVLALARRRRVR